MRIVIVEDDKEFSEKAEEIVQNCFKGIEEAVSVKRCTDGNALLNELKSGRSYDLYFLDVEMPEINGLDLAGEIRFMEADAVIVFLSAYEKYAVPSYRVRAYYYILKEECESEIPAVLKRIWQERLDARKDYYVIHNALYGKRVRLNEIVYLLRVKKYVVFRCAGDKEYRERGSLGEIYCKLPHERFVYIDKGYIVNLKHVSDWEGYKIRLDTGIELTASRRMNLAFKDALIKFWREE